MNCEVGKNRRLSLVWNQIVLLFSFTHRVQLNILSPWLWKKVGKLSSCNWVFCKNELSPWKATYRLPPHHWTIRHSTVWENKQAPTWTLTWLNNICLTKRFDRWNDNPYEHTLKAANQGLCVRFSTRTGEMITMSSKLWCIELDTGMYSPLWTYIPQASPYYLDLVRYGCL